MLTVVMGFEPVGSERDSRSQPSDLLNPTCKVHRVLVKQTINGRRNRHVLAHVASHATSDDAKRISSYANRRTEIVLNNSIDPLLNRRSSVHL
jgi:hypothetical protein